jgi:hypothetical protein
VVIAGRAERFWSVLAAHSTWTLVSHTPLILVLALALSWDHERVVHGVQTLFARVSPWMVRLITGAALLVGSLLLLDAFWFYGTGELFIPA